MPQLHIKHWSDRADRDLFFSILSVKNIGTISGSEWNVIGSDMRTLGYGFTNEGCRQHFQGLRRSIVEKKGGGKLKPSVRPPLPVQAVQQPAQQPEEETEETASASLTPSSLKTPDTGIDPTRNPITRRPGPGRGRPRKKKGEASSEAASTENTEEPSPELLAAANGLRPLLPASSSSGSSGNAETVGVQSAPVSPGLKRRREPHVQSLQVQPPPQTVAPYPTQAPLSVLPLPVASAAWPFDNTHVHHHAQEPGDDNGQPSKRQRLDDATIATPAASMQIAQTANEQDDSMFVPLVDNDAAFSEDFPFEV